MRDEIGKLCRLIAHTRDRRICLIGVAGKPGSTLLRKADVALLLPAAEEACRVGLAPTTSTTMMLALGDALAVALMETRDFTPDDYRSFHPGGRLGARLARVGELMQSGDALPIVSPSAPMADVLIEITQKGLGLAVVMNQDGVLAGIITDGDLRRNMDGLLDRVAEDVMTVQPLTISAGERAAKALKFMNDKKRTSLIVCDPSTRKVTGVLHIHDCLRAGID